MILTQKAKLIKQILLRAFQKLLQYRHTFHGRLRRENLLPKLLFKAHLGLQRVNKHRPWMHPTDMFLRGGVYSPQQWNNRASWNLASSYSILLSKKMGFNFYI